jgi:hypothetical protein
LQAVDHDPHAHTGSATAQSPARQLDPVEAPPGALRATLYASLEHYRPVVAHWQVERSSRSGLDTHDPAAQTVDFHDTNEAAFDADHLETVIERALSTWHQLAAADGLEPVDGPRARVYSAQMDDGQRGDLYVSAWVRRSG